jgi:alpha-beta hydrolase superfamily lysophospholipase
LKRDEFFFPSGDVNLKGYYYPADDAKGLLVLAHGFHAGADNYLPIIEYFVNHSYSVFTYDSRATYSSEGENQIGMCQSLVDLDNALKFIKGHQSYNSMPIFLLGHSWGGYAVTSAIALHGDVKACAAIAPMYSGYDIMVEKAEQYVGKLAAMPRPIFNVYQKILFGDYIKYNGVSGINSSDIPVLIAHGIDDKIITYDAQSIVSHKDEITNPNVVYYTGYGTHGDHNNIWHSKESAIYQMEIAHRLKHLEFEKGDALSYEEKCEFYKTVDHRLYSEVNAELMDQILEIFNKTLYK